jgi:hypothetical protein
MCWTIENRTLIILIINFFVTNLVFGQSVKTEQQIKFENWNDKGKSITLSAGAATANTIYTFPSSDGANGQVLSTNGSGALNWNTVLGLPAGTNSQTLRYNGTNIVASSVLTNDGTVIQVNGNLEIINNDNSAKDLKFFEPSGSGNNYTSFKAQAQGGDITYTLPVGSGSDGATLTTDGAGSLSWALPSAPTLAFTTYNSAATISSSDQVVLAGGSTAFALTLPSAVGLSGKVIYLKRKNTNSNNITINCQTGETIDGLTYFYLTTAYNLGTVISDGSNWWLISR